MKKSILTVFLLLAFSLALSEGVNWNGREWDGAIEGEYPYRNCDIVSIGREPARTDSIPYADAQSAIKAAAEYDKSLSPFYMLLSGTEWKFSWYENPEAAEAESGFFAADYDTSAWDEIYVPSVWQTQGYDYPVYTNSTQKFAKQSGNNVGYPRQLPMAPETYNPVGLYRHGFTLPQDCAGQRIYITFEGVDSALYLWINGIQAGYSEDSFTTHEFDVTDYVIPGEENMLAVKVYRWCGGSWIEDQDMYDLSGIFRDVYIYAAPEVSVRDYTVITDFDSTFTDSTLGISVLAKNKSEYEGEISVTVHLYDADGHEAALENACQNALLSNGQETEIEFSIPVTAPRKWSAEDPYLYTLVLEETSCGNTIYESCLVGFRKITYKTNESGWYEGSTEDADLIRINGQPIMFRGVNRHETHPEYGYALTKEVMEEDIRIILENNINSVRTSHYPNSNYWYYLCDRYGIYVVDEANVECHSNMTTENERLTDYLSSAIIDREYSMVRRDKNHASVIMWSLGNENKNPEILKTILINEYPDPEGSMRVLHEYTKDRPWHYEQARSMYETGIDVRSGMYALVDELAAHGEADGSVPMIECEYEHAMGNSCGNFDEYWEVYEKYRNLQGGFIWDYIDQSIYAYADDGTRYFGFGGDYGDHSNDGNFCANGLLFPDRTVQPEMAEVKYHYQQINIEDIDAENGLFLIKNWHLFTDPAEKYVFEWEVTSENTVISAGIIDPEYLHIPCVDSLTNQAGSAEVRIPYEIEAAALIPGHLYYLTIRVRLINDSGLLKARHVAAQQQFELHPDLPAASAGEYGVISCVSDNGLTEITGNNFHAVFDESLGRLVAYTSCGRELIVAGEGPYGNFFRGRTDNDTGFDYGLFVFNNSWKVTGEYIIESFETECCNDRAVISVSGYYPTLNGMRLTTVYTVYADGVIALDVSIIPNYDKNFVYLPVAGLTITIPSAYENLIWFGLGPEETYIDRYKGTIAGLWSTTATDNFIPYIESSETGNHVGVQYAALTDDLGNGIMAVSLSGGFEMSALHYTAVELDRHVHPYELNMSEDIYFRINAIQEGVGGDNSWSRTVTHDEYLPQDEKYEYSFALCPVKSGDDLTEISAEIRTR